MQSRCQLGVGGIFVPKQSILLCFKEKLFISASLPIVFQDGNSPAIFLAFVCRNMRAFFKGVCEKAGACAF
jgi:hypothetical protein